MAEVYSDGMDQGVGDDDWILRTAAERWIALTKDYAIIRDHATTLAATDLRVFALNSASLSGAQMAERFDTNLNRIVQRSTKPGPYVYIVGAHGIERRWPPSPAVRGSG